MPGVHKYVPDLGQYIADLLRYQLIHDGDDVGDVDLAVTVLVSRRFVETGRRLSHHIIYDSHNLFGIVVGLILRSDIIHQILAFAVLCCGNLEELVGGDIGHIHRLRTARACAEHETHGIVVLIDRVGLRVPFLAAYLGGSGQLVTGPVAVLRCMTTVTTPRPEVHTAPSYLVGIHMDGDVVFLEGAGLECREDDALRLNAADIINVVVAAENLLPPCACRLVTVYLRANHTEQLAVLACGLHGIVVLIRGHIDRRTGVCDANGLAHSHHIGDLLLIGFPMGQEHAWRARHGQQKCIGCQRILLDGILVGVGALLRVVVLHEVT